MSDLPTDFQHPSAKITTTYTACRRAETEVKGRLRHATTKTEKTKQEKHLVDVRIIGYLLSEGSDAAKEHIAKSIQSIGVNDQGQLEPKRSEDDQVDEIIKLGGFFFAFFIRIFRRTGGRTPAPSHHPSRPSFDNMQQAIQVTMTEASHDHSSVKKNALCRDNFRCVMSGKFDYYHYEMFPEMFPNPAPGTVAMSQCAHIIPEALKFDLDKTKKSAEVANIWTVLGYFGHRGLHLDLLGPDIHRLENVLTLEAMLHTLFDTLRVWLDATDTPHRYRIRHVDSFHPIACGYNFPHFVELTSTDPERLPLPNPAYLSLHASCCRVAHLSGAAGFLEWMDGHEDSFSSPVPSVDLSAALAARLLFLETQSSASVQAVSS